MRPGGEFLRDRVCDLQRLSAAEPVGVLVGPFALQADRDASVSDRVRQLTDPGQHLRTERAEVDELLCGADAARDEGATTVAGVEERTQRLGRSVGAIEDRVRLVQHQRRCDGLDLSVEHGLGREDRSPRSSDDQFEHFQQPRFAAAFLRAGDRQERGLLERVEDVGVGHPQSRRVRLSRPEHDVPAHVRSEGVEQRCQVSGVPGSHAAASWRSRRYSALESSIRASRQSTTSLIARFRSGHGRQRGQSRCSSRNRRRSGQFHPNVSGASPSQMRQPALCVEPRRVPLAGLGPTRLALLAVRPEVEDERVDEHVELGGVGRSPAAGRPLSRRVASLGDSGCGGGAALPGRFVVSQGEPPLEVARRRRRAGSATAHRRGRRVARPD